MPNEVHSTSVPKIVKYPQEHSNSGNPEKQPIFPLTCFQEILKIVVGHENKRPTTHKSRNWSSWPFARMHVGFFRGGLAEWSNAAGLQPADGALIAVHGSESLTRRQNHSFLAEALTSTGNRTAQPKPYEPDTSSIRLLAVELNRRFHSGLPQLPDRVQSPRD